jgi:heat shock protein HslJ
LPRTSDPRHAQQQATTASPVRPLCPWAPKERPLKYRLLLLPLALVACSQAPSSRTSAAPPAAATAQANSPAANTSVDTTLLGKYHWQLIEATDNHGKRIDTLYVRADKPLQLDFMQNRVSVGNSCNSLIGNYSVDGGRLKVGPMAQTMMACPDQALTDLDEAISQRLQGNSKLSIRNSDEALFLSLVTDGGDTLVFTGLPTAETRYGGEGEVIFLEVASQTKPCSHPLSPNMQCLQVRELKYDKNGVAIGMPGEWQPLSQNIEGYTHEAGIRNVLRVKRFNVKNPPAGAPSTAYVLDLVVESEVVKQ